MTIDYWVVKIDSLGNKQWDKRFGGTRNDLLFSLQQTVDGGYILGGYSESKISGDKTQNTWGSSSLDNDFWIVKIDSLGNKQWDKDFGGTSQDFLHSLRQTSDGGFILGGWSYSGVSGDKTEPNCSSGSVHADYWVIKIDSNGNKQWDKDFGGDEFDELYTLQQTTDGGYILGGRSQSNISCDKTQDLCGFPHDYWVIKIDSSGNKQWDKDLGGSNADDVRIIQQTIDGGYILGGKSHSDSSCDKTQNIWGSSDYWIIKVDSSWNKEWDKDFGGYYWEDLYSLEQTDDSGFLLAGYSGSGIGGDKTESNLGGQQTWIVKTDSLGIKQWDKTIFTPGYDRTGLAIKSKQGCYVFANYTDGGIGGYKTQTNWDPTNLSHDFWIVKFCDTTVTTSINQIYNSQSSISIYPNPTNAILNLSLNNIENIVITNALSEIVFHERRKGNIELDVSFLSAGIYFIKVGSDVRKFVKE